MEAEVFQRLSEQEECHWWFRARRCILKAMLERYAPAHRPLIILEAGCGTGGNLAMLADLGMVSAFELDGAARAYAAGKGFVVEEGRLPESHPYTEQTFDVIVLFDVLEHVEEDQASLNALSRLLKPGGCLMLTVPAFPILWSGHDSRHHHFRRYRRSLLRKRLQEAGFSIHRLSYYNFWLFPIIALVRLIKKTLRSEDSDEMAIPRPAINRVLEIIFASERFLLPFLSFPFGVSLWAVAKVPESREST